MVERKPNREHKSHKATAYHDITACHHHLTLALRRRIITPANSAVQAPLSLFEKYQATKPQLVSRPKAQLHRVYPHRPLYVIFLQVPAKYSTGSDRVTPHDSIIFNEHRNTGWQSWTKKFIRRRQGTQHYDGVWIRRIWGIRWRYIHPMLAAHEIITWRIRSEVAVIYGSFVLQRTEAMNYE